MDYKGPPCPQCGGNRWKRVHVPLFRVEECVQCHTNRALTDPGSLIEAEVNVQQIPTYVVYLVFEVWGTTGRDVVGVYINRKSAEEVAQHRHDPNRPGVLYEVQAFEVVGDRV
jgi:hypothetical protein